MFKRIIFFTAVFAFISLSAYPENLKGRKQEIADSLYEVFIAGGDHLGYSLEILDYLYLRYSITPAKRADYRSEDYRYRERGDNGVDFYSLLSGGLAIRESLQLNTINPSIQGGGKIDIRTLIPPQVKSHPFSDMLKGREYRVFPLDRCIPADFYSVHFSDTTKALQFFDYVTEVGGSLHSRYTMSPVDFNVKEKIMTQLALKENKDARAFYSSVIDEMAITGSDPFVIEGADVTLVMKIKSPIVFNTTIAMYRSEFKKTFDAEVRKVNVSGIEGEYMTADYRRINSVIVRLPDDIVVISNSIRAVETVVATFQKKHQSLAESPDYMYMRSIYTSDRGTEDGFIYLSDSFIRHLVSPELRIKEARRMAAAAVLAKFERYIIYSYQLNGRLPVNSDEVLAAMELRPLTDDSLKLLSAIKAHRHHEDAVEFEGEYTANWDVFVKALRSLDQGNAGGSSKKRSKVPANEEAANRYVRDLKNFYKGVTGITPAKPSDVISLLRLYSDRNMNIALMFKKSGVVTGGFSAYDEVYGRMGLMVPNIELEAGKVSESEAENYRRFADEYTDYWKNFFDPVGVRFRFTDNGITVDTCILPLIENSIYNSLKALFGGSPVTLHPDYTVKGDILSASFKFNIENFFKENGIFGEYMSGSDGLKAAGSIFGDELQIHMGDVSPMIDIEGSEFTREVLRGGWSNREMLAGFLIWSFFHPMRVAVPVKKPAEAMNFIDSVSGTGHSRYGQNINVTKYAIDYNRTRIDVMKVNYFGIATSRFFYCIKDGMLHFATTEKYIKDVIDSGKFSGAGVDRNIAAVFRPADMVLEKNSYTSGIIESALEAGKKNNGTIKLLDTLFPDAKSEELPKLAYRNFGFMPVCPFGGTYSVNDKGEVINSVYGSSYSPVIKGVGGSTGTSAALKRFFSTKEVRLEFEFTPEGIKTTVKTE